MDQLVCGVGTVCVAHAGLEWSLAYFTHAMRGWDDAKLAEMLGKPGRVWHAFGEIADGLPEPLGSDVRELRDRVGRLRGERDQLVHAVIGEGN